MPRQFESWSQTSNFHPGGLSSRRFCSHQRRPGADRQAWVFDRKLELQLGDGGFRYSEHKSAIVPVLNHRDPGLECDVFKRVLLPLKKHDITAIILVAKNE